MHLVWVSFRIEHPWYQTLTRHRTLGMTPSKVKDEDVARRVSIEYTMAAARIFNESCQKPFKFVYCSGSGAEQDQTKSLWFMQNYRRIRVSLFLLSFSLCEVDSILTRTRDKWKVNSLLSLTVTLTLSPIL